MSLDEILRFDDPPLWRSKYLTVWKGRGVGIVCNLIRVAGAGTVVGFVSLSVASFDF